MKKNKQINKSPDCLKLGVVMDPIQDIHIAKDTTFAMLLAAQKRGWPLYYMEQTDLFLRDGVSWARMRALTVTDDSAYWFSLQEESLQALQQLDVILMRKDPPLNLEYIYTTQILEFAQEKGVLIVNNPRSLRDYNEKLIINWFPQCCAPTLVTRDIDKIREFLAEFKDIICKPLHSMGGYSVFRVRQNDPNVNVILEMMLADATHSVMAQCFIPEIEQGDKRIILLDGTPVPYALSRIPIKGETRANLHVGGQGIAQALTARDYWICEQIAPFLRKNGILFAGIDVIGDYLTEINITSPTCVREIDQQCGTNIADQFMEYVLMRKLQLD